MHAVYEIPPGIITGAGFTGIVLMQPRWLLRSWIGEYPNEKIYCTILETTKVLLLPDRIRSISIVTIVSLQVAYCVQENCRVGLAAFESFPIHPSIHQPVF